jgi:hypothetical protein
VGPPAAVDEAPRDIDAQLRMDYRREDDCSLAIVQEDGGVIAAGSARLTLDSDWSGYDPGQPGFKLGRHIVVALMDGVEIAGGDFVVERRYSDTDHARPPRSFVRRHLLGLSPATRYGAAETGPSVGSTVSMPLSGK